jgi:hypothetical protein
MTSEPFKDYFALNTNFFFFFLVAVIKEVINKDMGPSPWSLIKAKKQKAHNSL